MNTSDTAGLQTRWNNWALASVSLTTRTATAPRSFAAVSACPISRWKARLRTCWAKTCLGLTLRTRLPLKPIQRQAPSPTFRRSRSPSRHHLPTQPLTTAALVTVNPRIVGRDFRNQTSYYESWNFNIERQIGASTLAELGYAGSHGSHLLFSYNPQEVLPGPASVPSNNRVTLPGIASVRNIIQLDPRNSSNFHSLQAKLTKRLTGGVQFLAGYTWSKSLDYGGSAASGGGANGGPQTITNLRAGYGPSGFDVRHRFVGSWVYELPFGPGRHWLTSGFVGNILGNWDLDGIATVSTGRPFTVYLSSGVTNGAPSWPDRLASGERSDANRAHWYDPTAFVAPSTPRYGNEGRGVLYSPGFTNFDLSLVKNFSIVERLKAQFRVDAFNAFNHPQFGFPNQNVNTGNPASTDTSITNTLTDNRDLQLSIRLVF